MCHDPVEDRGVTGKQSKQDVTWVLLDTHGRSPKEQDEQRGARNIYR